MPQWLNDALEQSKYFMPHGHCYLWLPGLLWLHVVSDLLIGVAYLGISLILYVLVRKIRLPFSWVFIAFGLFIGLCGLTHFMKVWTVWNPDYLADGLLKGATAAASVATAIGLLYVRPQVEAMVNAARTSDERRVKLEQAHEELRSLYHQVRELDQQRSRFFANVSHELRTPLALILGPAEQLLGSADIDASQRRQLEGISRNGKILLKQVNDLLDVAKIDAGKVQPYYSRLDMAELVRRIAGYFDLVAEQRSIAYRVDAPAILEAEADRDMAERIVVNLLSNAFKFTPDGGTIVVSLQRDGSALRIVVEDSGPGIDPACRVSVFERFAQADGEATRLHGGTGLGLAIVRELCQLHGGTAVAGQSGLGGACMAVTLPLAAPEGAEVGAAAAGPSDAHAATMAGTVEMLAPVPEPAASPTVSVADGRPTVLVVEDNPEMRRFVVDILAPTFQVSSVGDGAAGLQRILAAPPDLVISDIMMPGMSGDQLVEAMRLHEQLDSVPVLLLTARADEELRVRMLRGGAQDYLAKPFLPAELQARAANLVTLKRAGDVMRTALSSASFDVAGLAQELAAKQAALLLALNQASVASEAAERASQVKSMFLSLVSHELRTPLSTISMNVQMLERDPQLAPAAGRQLARVARAAGLMRELVDSLLEYIRVESGRIALHIEAIDALALVREVVEAHRGMAPAQLDLLIEAGPDVPMLRTDLRLLRVVLSNLVANAIKFTQHGSVKIALSHAGGWHVFSVRDTGPGIAQADLGRIFAPFEQLASLEHKTKPGFGLGLALVQRMVDELGGTISVASAPGEGSTFELRLRAADTDLGAAHG